ncbi:hypothetical protein C8F01DRAFT_1374705 [Mycena amicta]|nr:hypothetical protein C8F01DRAFT_1374705 [Mycena amicta]
MQAELTTQRSQCRALLNTRHNHLPYICKLSPELLLEIFLLLAAFTRIDTDHPHRITPAQLRTATLDVCQYWRDVAQSSARLWGFFIDYVLDSSEFVQDALERTLCTPLHIEASVIRRPSARRNVLLALKNAANRIQVLDLALSGKDVEILAPGLVKAAPMMQVLRIGCDVGGFVDIPASVFAGEALKLRELQLEGCIIARDSHLLQERLTYLSIDRTPPTSAFSVPCWLQILKLVPMLEVLSLTRCFKSFDDTTSVEDALSDVRLPHLFSIALDGRLSDCSGILNHLDFPATLCLEIKCFATISDIHTGSALAGLIQPIAENFKHLPDFQKLRSLGISWQYTGVTLRGSPAESARVDSTADDTEFLLVVKGEDSLPYEPMLSVVEALATDDVRVLDLSTPLCACGPPSHFIFRSDDDDDWGALLRCFPAVHTLKQIKDDWAESVLDILRSRDTDYTLFLPNLRTMDFANVSFVNGSTVGATVRPALLALVQMRKECRSAIRRVNVDFCKGVTEEMCVELSNEGVYVSWDGENRFGNEKSF